jgi:tRNA(fMet)-specific endonuclease VapC
VHLLDTDTLSRLHAGHPGAQEHIRRLEDPELATTLVTKAELLRGRFEFLLKAATGSEILKAQKWLTKTEALLAELRILPFDARSAIEFDRLRARPKARKIGRADLLIASMALAHHAVLVTRNLRDFRRNPGLEAINWID